ncbi:zf-DHHC-domain-containing protein [Hypoxylon sp. FL1284]|nr:zf-DHHC-domain-containing protein [Hypoxylon sp. FL1284]
MAFLVGSTEPALQRLAVPAVCVLIAFLAYASQWLFANSPDLEPGPLTPTETYAFNGLLLCLWYSYYKACTTDPGRYVFPPGVTRRKRRKSKAKQGKSSGSDTEDEDEQEKKTAGGIAAGGRQTRRWCRKCAAPKPPRAHHCRTCGRCVPKMDHHCPWTANCVSLQTFPHFLRFLAFTNLSLWALLRLLAARFAALWERRRLPAYLGPTLPQLALLTVLTLVAAAVAFALGILLFTTVRGWLFNTTMIEGWEIDRHEAAIERRLDAGSSASAWWAEGGDGADDGNMPPDAVEFPYDVGIFANMAAAMGTRNPLLWPLPFAGGPKIAVPPSGAEEVASWGTGWEYEENGLNDREGMWPPPDPDKVRHARAWRRRRREADRALALDRARLADPDDDRAAFRRRQELDLRRRQQSRVLLDELEELPPGSYDDYDFVDEAYERYDDDGGAGVAEAGSRRPGVAVVVDEGKSGWVNADGERLGDYGVDSDAEFDELPLEGGSSREPAQYAGDYEDEDVPLAELIRRRKVRTGDGEDT